MYLVVVAKGKDIILHDKVKTIGDFRTRKSGGQFVGVKIKPEVHYF